MASLSSLDASFGRSLPGCTLSVTLFAVLANLASANLFGAISSDTSCNREIVEPTGGGACAWNAATACASCGGTCILATTSSPILQASTMLTFQSGLCTGLTAAFNLLAAYASEDFEISFDYSEDGGSAIFDLACPSEADIRAGYALMTGAMNDVDQGELDAFSAMSGNALDSADNAVRFLSNNCENRDEPLPGTTAGAGPVCQQRNSDIDHDARLEGIVAECLNVSNLEDGQCLPSDTFAHLDADCLMAHATDVSDATAADVTAITEAFMAIHTACSAFTDQASCVGAALESQVSASTTAMSAVQTREVSLIVPSKGIGSCALSAFAAVAAFMAALA